MARLHQAGGVLAAMTTIVGPAPAQEAYRLPPEPITRILDAAPPPSVSADPSGRFVVIVEPAAMPVIADLAQPMLRLAGLRINPATGGAFTVSYNVSLALKSLGDGSHRRIELPPGARVGDPEWSPDGARVAFTVTRPEGIELWVADVTDARARRVLGPRLCTVGGRGYRWMADGRLVCRLVPGDRGPLPQPPPAPTGPLVQERSGRTSPLRTWQDLLASPTDEAQFEHLMRSRIHLVDPAAEGRERPLGEPGLYWDPSPSPDGRFLLVRRVMRPFSCQVPAWLFPERVEVWDVESGAAVHHVTDLPLRDTTPIEGVPTGPRDIEWQATADSARLVWAEALDGGDPRAPAAHRDRVMMHAAPFAAPPVEVARTEHRFTGLNWLELSSFALLSEYDRDRRWTRTWLIAPGAPGDRPRLIWDRSARDRYGDPGRPVQRRNRGGHDVILVVEGCIFLAGAGASAEGDRPFLDRLNLVSAESTRLWRCAAGTYEGVGTVLPDGRRFITRHESPAEPPNHRLHETGAAEAIALTDYRDPAPELRGITKRLITYPREDGVTLSATLYLPPGYVEGTRLPLLVWAYPLEYNDPYTAGQVSGSAHRFDFFRGPTHLFLLTQGYAILDGATMPVIGDPERMNDTFIAQVVASAAAAIDAAVDLGVADRDRVAVGGHSYGAFMTANLLAHSDLFRAGIARSGAYNRTLTPFGFQSERRTLWEAPSAYIELSPFMHADRIDEPILLIHGEMDNNSGTFPLQSQRLYHAVGGHGGTARLVMLPFESHGYAARESILHVLAEMVDWLDRFVKDAPSAGAGAAGVR
jgi:dipeptidyl aminopeptidase/acylaminoacyl peptidase